LGFGQHQTFYLRTYWLRKAIQQIDNNSNRVFFEKNVSELIGLGNNMVNSLKHWITAADICETSKRETDNKIVHIKTPFGELFNKFDPFIEINDTASIIHYHLVDEKEPCTTWYWFFNEYDKKVFEKSEILTDLVNWINKEYAIKPSLDTLDRDIDCLIKQYYSKSKSIDPEEVIQSPLTVLNLIEEKNGNLYKKSPNYEEIGLTALMYVLLKYNQYEISINEIENSKLLWGKVFNMQRSEIVRAIEQLASSTIYPLEFDRTNRLDLVRVKPLDPIGFLREEYIRKERVLK
jgi:hypothetical protein